MKPSKPSPAAGSGSNAGPGRKRYFVNIVTEDQILHFQNEVSTKESVPLLAPGKRENRLLILAPNSETIDSFQKRALTQFQYISNVSAESVRLLESHFCEVPKSYSVSDALDAKSEAYLVVDSIRPLGPGAKRKASESLGGTPAQVASPRSEPSSKRVRRREKQAVKTTSSENEDGDNQTPVPESPTNLASHTVRHSSEQTSDKSSRQRSENKSASEPRAIASSGQQSSSQSSSGLRPLFGRSRAESERKPSWSSPVTLEVTPAKPAVSTKPASQLAQSSNTMTGDINGVENSGLTGKKKPSETDGDINTSQETPKPKRGRPSKATPTTSSATPRSAAEPALPNADIVNLATTTPTRNGQSNSQNSRSKEEATDKAKPKTAEAETQAKTQDQATSLGNGEAHSQPRTDAFGGNHENNEQLAESAASADSSDFDESDSSGSESDSGERQRRMLRRRVVAVPNGTTARNSNSKSQSVHTRTTKPSPGKTKNGPVPDKEQTTPNYKTDAPATPTAEHNSSEPVAESRTEARKSSTSGTSRVPGLGSLADLASMRLPPVHESQSKQPEMSNKKPAEESSEEEDDVNESDDSNDSDSSEDSSDSEDESTAGRKSRKRGLLGLLGNK